MFEKDQDYEYHVGAIGVIVRILIPIWIAVNQPHMLVLSLLDIPAWHHKNTVHIQVANPSKLTVLATKLFTSSSRVCLSRRDLCGVSNVSALYDSIVLSVHVQLWELVTLKYAMVS